MENAEEPPLKQKETKDDDLEEYGGELEEDLMAQLLEVSQEEDDEDEAQGVQGEKEEDDDDDDDDDEEEDEEEKQIEESLEDGDYSETDEVHDVQTDERPYKKRRLEAIEFNGRSGILSGSFAGVPPELFRNILKFLSSEDLSTCAKVCQFLRFAASDEALWRRLYCLRWGLPLQLGYSAKPRGTAWKQLYFERDRADMMEFVRNTPTEFREYYLQMQAAKRSQAPLRSQVIDDMPIVDETVAEQVTAWKKSKKLVDAFIGNHCCSGKTCSYHQIGDVFVCEKTGCAHVCDDNCRETVLDPSNELLVCTVSGRCFDLRFSPEDDDRQHEHGIVVMEEAEPFLGSGRLARAYWLGYNCANDQEFDEALREVMYSSC